MFGWLVVWLGWFVGFFVRMLRHPLTPIPQIPAMISAWKFTREQRSRDQAGESNNDRAGESNGAAGDVVTGSPAVADVLASGRVRPIQQPITKQSRWNNVVVCYCRCLSVVVVTSILFTVDWPNPVRRSFVGLLVIC